MGICSLLKRRVVNERIVVCDGFVNKFLIFSLYFFDVFISFMVLSVQIFLNGCRVC